MLRRRTDKSEGCGGHSALVIGSRFEGGKCQYLLRNNWKCYEGEYKTSKCDATGDAWIDSELLLNNIYSTTRIVTNGKD